MEPGLIIAALVGVIGLLVVLVVAWAWWERRHGPQPMPEPEPGEADDLAVIEGIGPRIHDVLHDAGITTFEQLAATPVEKLESIIVDAELPPAHPDTWPEQARLAAAGQWDELKKMQETLKGGLRA